ncbi:MAG: phosphatidylinositol synthase, partial [Pseudonocardiales bacterium]
MTPNGISLAGMAIAAVAGACLALVSIAGSAVGQVVLLAGAAVLVQLRLVCNMLDGLLAVEGGMGTRTGPLFNEVPDRIADLFILVGAGYAIRWVDWGPELGWLAGVLAVLTAYVRLLGGSLGFVQWFSGPMAKPQRMAVLTLASLVSIVEAGAREDRGGAPTIGLVLI